MKADHIARPGRATSGKAPASGQVLAIVSSPPLSVMLRLMDVPSDDLFAELFAKQLGNRFGRGGTIADGAQVIVSTIADTLRPAPEDPRRLRAVAQRTAPRRSRSSNCCGGCGAPRSAAAGRVAAGRRRQRHRARDRGPRPPAQGNCVAKTGTLNDVTNLAGYCQRRGRPHAGVRAVHRRSGQLAARWCSEGRMIAAIARY